MIRRPKTTRNRTNFVFDRKQWKDLLWKAFLPKAQAIWKADGLHVDEKL
jgi:hypothetical protein